RYNLTFRLDHTLNSRNRLTFRYSRSPSSAIFSSVYPNAAANTMNTDKGGGHWWYGSWTRVVSPGVINELRLTYRTNSFRTYGGGGGEGWPSKLGLNGVSNNYFPRIEPGMGAGAYAALGTADQDRTQGPQYNGQLAETLSWVRGRHSLKFGAEMRP